LNVGDQLEKYNGEKEPGLAIRGIQGLKYTVPDEILRILTCKFFRGYRRCRIC
jgi:hypothetical protein